MPYNDAVGVAKMDGKIYVATENSLFYLDVEEETLNRVSTVNGLSDVGISTMAKKPKKKTKVVSYNSPKKYNNVKNSIYCICY